MPIDEYIERGKKALQRLIETPISNWENSQWLLAAFVALLLLWCCGCICQGQRRHRRYYRGAPAAGEGAGNYYNAGAGGQAGTPVWFGGSPMMSGMGQQQQRGSSGGGGVCGCVRNIVVAACCFEFCCRDCQDVNQAMLGNQYSLKGFGDGTIV